MHKLRTLTKKVCTISVRNKIFKTFSSFLKNISLAEVKLNEAEKELDESPLNQNLRDLKAKRHEQSKLIEQYKLEVSHLEYQLSVIKKNAESLDSLENRCFKRTRLEP